MLPLLRSLKLMKEGQMVQPNYNGVAQMSMLPYEKQLIIDAKVPLFELEKRSRARLDSNDMGYVNVKAIKNDNSDNLPIQLIWFSGRKGYVRYSRDRNGRYVGYCPDDPEWFNRTKLSSTILSGKFKISKYINESGLITVGNEITEEIRFIGVMLHDWMAKIDGVVVIRSKQIKEVQEYVNKKRAEGIAIQGPMFGLIEKIERIREFHRHDWLFSPEYQQEIIPEMKKRIKQKFNQDVNLIKSEKPEIEEMVSKMIPDILSKMSIQQLGNIIKKKMEEQKDDPVILNGELFYEGIALKDLPYNKIKTIAVKNFSIKTKGLTRDELITMIDKRIKDSDGEEESQDVNEILGPPTPEEIKNREAAGLPPLETIESI